VFRALIRVGADPNLGSSVQTPLKAAIGAHSLSAVHLLLLSRADPNKAIAGSTPLHTAMYNRCDVNMLRALLAAGADVDAREEEHGRTALHLALR